MNQEQESEDIYLKYSMPAAWFSFSEDIRESLMEMARQLLYSKEFSELENMADFKEEVTLMIKVKRKVEE